MTNHSNYYAIIDPANPKINLWMLIFLVIFFVKYLIIFLLLLFPR